MVVIGRNEGERLRLCLESVCRQAAIVVYVDSGSTDNSVEMARQRRVEVVELDMSTHFTAARARNAGLARLLDLQPECGLVQFVDGDCALIEGWLETSRKFMSSHDRVACVCGRLKERFPDRTIYNQFCDLEWDRPPGITHACGGIATMRCTAVTSVGGFDALLVAGEEPELCSRLRAQGWQIWRLPDDMAWHDADIRHFSQWWQRASRGGYALAQTAWLRRADPERPYLKARASSLFWAAAMPVAIVVAMAAFGWTGAYLALIYPVQVVRLAWQAPAQSPLRWTRAGFLVLGRFAELWGQWQFWLRNRLGRASAARFDYKS